VAKVRTAELFASDVAWCEEAEGQRVRSCRVEFSEEAVWPGYFAVDETLVVELENGQSFEVRGERSSDDWRERPPIIPGGSCASGHPRTGYS
jgi:hypothetical protein